MSDPDSPGNDLGSSVSSPPLGSSALPSSHPELPGDSTDPGAGTEPTSDSSSPIPSEGTLLPVPRGDPSDVPDDSRTAEASGRSGSRARPPQHHPGPPGGDSCPGAGPPWPGPYPSPVSASPPPCPLLGGPSAPLGDPFEGELSGSSGRLPRLTEPHKPSRPQGSAVWGRMESPRPPDGLSPDRVPRVGSASASASPARAHGLAPLASSRSGALPPTFAASALRRACALVPSHEHPAEVAGRKKHVVHCQCSHRRSSPTEPTHSSCMARPQPRVEHTIRVPPSLHAEHHLTDPSACCSQASCASNIDNISPTGRTELCSLATTD